MTSLRWVQIGVAVALLVLPMFLRAHQFVLDLLILTLFYVGLTAAWNLLTFGGKLSLGHAAFFGSGAYVTTLLFLRLDIKPMFGVLGAILVALLIALLQSLALIRLRGPFFTLASIAFAEVLKLIAVHWRSVTGGSVGLNIPFRPGWLNLTFGTKEPYYYIALFLAVVSIWVGRTLYHSATGYFLRASASDEEAAQALGINTTKAQLTAFFLSAGLTSVLGVFYAFFVYVLEPATFFSMELFSLQPALNGIIGGMGTVWGPVIGAVIMTPLGELLRIRLGAVQQGLHFLVYGFVLIMIVRALPGGLISLWSVKRGRGRGSQVAQVRSRSEA